MTASTPIEFFAQIDTTTIKSDGSSRTVILSDAMQMGAALLLSIKGKRLMKFTVEEVTESEVADFVAKPRQPFTRF